MNAIVKEALVMPAKAGIQWSLEAKHYGMDSRLRGNDEQTLP